MRRTLLLSSMLALAVAGAGRGLAQTATNTNTNRTIRAVPGTIRRVEPAPRTAIERARLPRQEALEAGPRVSDRFRPPPAAAVKAASPQAIMRAAAVKAVEPRLSAAPLGVASRPELTRQLRVYEAAEADARQAGDGPAAGVAALNYARTLQTALRVQAEPEEKRPLLVEKYLQAIAQAPPREQALARNSLATVYLEEKQYGQAVQVLQEMDWSNVAPEGEYICHYNLGRAQELNGDSAAALAQYQQVIEQRPTYQPAVQGAFRLLRQSRDAAATAALAEKLIEQGESAQAMDPLRQALRELGNAPGAEALLTALVNGYTAQRARLELLESKETGFLKQLEDMDKLRKPVRELEEAFAADWEPSFSRSDMSRQFSAWSGSAPQKEALSRFLQMLGDAYSQSPAEARRRPQQGLACYAAAWALDQANTDAALYAAALLQAHPEELDPNQTRLMTLVNQLFQVKGSAYSIPVKTRQDWLNLMRLHLVLGSIFEKSGRWGSEHDPESALFQLLRASWIEDELRSTDPSLMPSPDLYSRLGRAFREAGRKEEALGQYLRAAEGFVYFHQAPQTRTALADAAALPIEWNDEQRARAEKVRASLRELGAL